jgi:hypothetical protein
MHYAVVLMRPGEGTASLEFISDSAARDGLRSDIAAAHRALGNGEYKAATVLAGSVSEALLLWAIKQSNNNKLSAATQRVSEDRRAAGGRPLDRKGPEHWHLADFVDVTVALEIIDPATAANLRLSNDYRNVIHAGRALRMGESCSQATALTALGGMERLIEVLTRRVNRQHG